MSEPPWDALRQVVRTALREDFAGVGADGLGESMRMHVDAWLADPQAPKELRRFRQTLESFDQLGRQDRKVLVARAMRLCAMQPKPDAAPPRKQRRDEPEVKTTVPKPRGRSARVKPEPGPAQPIPGVATLKGVGPSTADKLAAKGLHTLVDLAYVLPSSYDDRRRRKPLSELEDGDTAVVEATVGSVRQGFARGRFMASMNLKVDEDDGSQRTVVARWFHRVGGLNRWSQGGRVLAIGPVKTYKGQLTMAHPEIRDVGEPGPAIAVRYPSVEGVAPRTLSRVIRTAVQRLSDPDVGFVDALPEAVASHHGLPTQLGALQGLHLPPDDAPEQDVEALAARASPFHRRLAFDEFFFFQLALLRERGQLREQPARVCPNDRGFDREILRACLPFEPTAAQWRVLGEIERDMSAGPPMLRLLQGDVGSGKTAVAFASALAVARSGGQTALMAPTEILAEQHLRTLTPWCEKAGINIGLLTGATPKASRASLLSLVAGRKIDLLIGTHALLTDDVGFAELGLAIVDEQHRFGVQQRAILRRKGQLPHLLVMTATPIPRTMALCAYGQLEVSVIDELPPGREPPKTVLKCGARGLASARSALAKKVAGGAKAFVVCPLVEASDSLAVTDVEATAAALRKAMPGRSVAVVHGRMSSADKDAIMREFRDGEAQVLVATTVIEVGVDIPDATVMMVEHAERFGLAQLHQLRGRVGRGGGSSLCLLHTGFGPKSDVARRLGVMTETHDGFVVAERDLQLRGPGEVFGTRQAGAPRLRFAGFAGEGTHLLVAARESARDLLERDPALEQHPLVVAELRRRRSGDAVITADAG